MERCCASRDARCMLALLKCSKTKVQRLPQSQPELLAHHYTQAGMTEAAVEWWRTAGQRSLARSALVEGVEQLRRALDQIAILPLALRSLHRRVTAFAQRQSDALQDEVMDFGPLLGRGRRQRLTQLPVDQFRYPAKPVAASVGR
jgi:hypothetical protein